MNKGIFQLTETAAKKLRAEIKYSRSRWGANHAKQYRRDLLAAVRKISKDPTIYQERPEIGQGIRCVRFKGNYIVYELNEQGNGIIVLNFPATSEENML